MADNLPIDIHSGKLLDWLVSRRHCNKDWQKNVLVIREKIKHAILDMPESEKIVQLLQGNYINFFHCAQIVDILKDTEKDTKNFLGFYSSQRMKDWQEIDSLYRRDNVNLAEASQMLQRLVQYEVPGLKKSITKSEHSAQEATKKQADYMRQAEEGKKGYEKELSRLGLSGKGLRAELLALAADLPAFFEQLSKDVIALAPAQQYYNNFRAYLHQDKVPSSVVLPIICLLVQKGADVTHFEWRTGNVPSSVEPPSFHLLLKGDENKEEEADEIDFGDDIDFGNDGGIDFGDEVEIAVVGDDSGSVVDTVARGDDALGLLEHPATQKKIKHELAELIAFLSSRISDERLETASDIFILGSEKRPDNINNVSVSQLSSWLSSAEAALASLRAPTRAHLFKIRTSPQYVETMVEELERKKSLEQRYHKMAALMVDRKKEADEAADAARKELKTMVDGTRELQKQLEGEISKKYSGRRVNLMGGINAVLASV